MEVKSGGSDIFLSFLLTCGHNRRKQKTNDVTWNSQYGTCQASWMSNLIINSSDFFLPFSDETYREKKETTDGDGNNNSKICGDRYSKEAKKRKKKAFAILE